MARSWVVVMPPIWVWVRPLMPSADNAAIWVTVITPS